MKKFLSLILLVTMLVVPATISVSAAAFEYDGLRVLDSEGNDYASPSEIVIRRCLPRDMEVMIDSYYARRGSNQIPEEMLNAVMDEALDGEYFCVFDLHTDDEDNRYPEVESVEIEFETQMAGGTMQSTNRTNIGKDYRVCYVEDDLTISAVPDCIITQGVTHARIGVDRLGKYVVYFNPEVCDITFFTGTPEYDEDTDVLLNPEECVYYALSGLKYKDTYEFPEIPEKEGYVFAGWLETFYWGKNLVNESSDDVGIGSGTDKFYANWIPEDEFEPFELKAEVVEPIRPGKENGKKVRITASHGEFGNDYFPAEWIEDYENEEDEEWKEYLLYEWKSQWQVIGNDELLIEKVEKIDRNTIEITLLGNSTDTNRNSELYFCIPGWVIGENEEDTFKKSRGQLNEYGFEKEMYTTDNSVNVRKKSSGGGGGASTVLISFETNGGEKIENHRFAWGKKVELPIPVKEGFVFEGWYTDGDLTQKADVKFKTSGTLYAKWVPENREENQLIMPIGKGKVKAFGKELENNIPPVIKEGRVYLPLRFVVTTCGGSVGWSGEAEKIGVFYNGTTATVYLKTMTASANGKTVSVENELFVEDGKTYISVDFITKNIGDFVTFDKDANAVIIER